MSWRNLRWRHQNKQTSKQIIKHPTTGHSGQYSYIFIYTYSLEPEELTPQKDEAWSDDGKKNAAKGARVIQLLEEAEKRKKKSTFGAPTSRINPAALYHKLVCCMSARR